MSAAFILLALVSLQRLAELIISDRNTKRLLADGAKEIGAGHYPFIVAVHTTWLIALFVWVGTSSPALSTSWLLVYIALQVFRLWVMVSLGRFWTTRIIVPRAAPLVRRGPYRFMRHPNYVVVVLEIAVLPLVVGAWPLVVVFSALNACALWVRIKAENRSFLSRSV
jgi:methyltransferase